MLANKKKSHEIKESEKYHFHVLITRKTFNYELKRIDVNESVQIFDKKGYEQFKKFKPADIDEVELLHDGVLQRTTDEEQSKKKESAKGKAK